MIALIPVFGKVSNNLILMAQTDFGEARGEPWPAKLGVCHVIVNRKNAHRKEFGLTIPTIVKKPQQFSCWSKNDANFIKIHNPLKYETMDTWIECYTAALLVLKGKVKDNTGGALWYIDESIVHDPPYWVAKLELSARHGRLYFFREKK